MIAPTNSTPSTASQLRILRRASKGGENLEVRGLLTQEHFRRVTGVDNTQRLAAMRQRHSVVIRIEECFGEAMFRFASVGIRGEPAHRKQRRIETRGGSHAAMSAFRYRPDISYQTGSALRYRLRGGYARH